MAKLRIIYREEKTTYGHSLESSRDFVTDSVQVEVREWIGDGRCDAILEVRLIMDHEEQYRSCRILDSLKYSDAQLQRMGIHEFDEAVAHHPGLQAQED